jgi:hypothetical protein
MGIWRPSIHAGLQTPEIDSQVGKASKTLRPEKSPSKGGTGGFTGTMVSSHVSSPYLRPEVAEWQSQQVRNRARRKLERQRKARRREREKAGLPTRPRSDRIFLAYQNMVLDVQGWSKLLHVKPRMIWSRLAKHWKTEDVLFKVSRRGRRTFKNYQTAVKTRLDSEAAWRVQ